MVIGLAQVGAGDTPFWWASVGKLFTATLILQLVEDGQVALDDRVSKWLPLYPGAELMTVNQLMTHTAGVFSFQSDKKWRLKKGHTTPDQLLKISARHQFDFVLALIGTTAIPVM